MPPDIVTAIGYVAGTLTTISFLPQLIKTWRCKSAKEISWAMLLAFALGMHDFVWTVAIAAVMFVETRSEHPERWSYGAGLALISASIIA